MRRRDLIALLGGVTVARPVAVRAQHADRVSTVRHIGDLGNLTATEDRTAAFDFYDEQIELQGPNSIIDKAFIVHAMEDDLTSQPAGNSGVFVWTQEKSLDGLKPGRVVHVHSPRPFASESGQELWSTEAWYTMNEVPGKQAQQVYYEAEEGNREGAAGLATDHRGYSGIGKSSVVHALQEPVVRRNGFFLSGKAEQFQRDIPYATLARAIRGLVRQLLADTTLPMASAPTTEAPTTAATTAPRSTRPSLSTSSVDSDFASTTGRRSDASRML